MMALFFILSGIALGVLGLVNVPVWTILFMLILPLFWIFHPICWEKSKTAL